MIYERLHVTIVGVVATLVDSVVAEFAGYWLHRLLHTDKFPALSRGHLIHHFLIFGPRQSMRAAECLDATDNRASVGNVGVEWLAPSAIFLLFCWGAMALLGVPPMYHQVLALCMLLGWPILMFSYLHDRMHIRNFWMTRVPLLRSWFLRARRLHDIHHRSVNSKGFMNTNFGIGFYFFDRFFRTMAKSHRRLNWEGCQAAIGRYGPEEMELLSLRGCSKALFHKETGIKTASPNTCIAGTGRNAGSSAKSAPAAKVRPHGNLPSQPGAFLGCLFILWDLNCATLKDLLHPIGTRRRAPHHG